MNLNAFEAALLKVMIFFIVGWVCGRLLAHVLFSIVMWRDEKNEERRDRELDRIKREARDEVERFRAFRMNGRDDL